MRVDKEVMEYYRRFRAQGGGIVGESALWALRDAKALQTFRTLEGQGLVRIKAEPEMESYFDVFGEPEDAKGREQIIATIERLGCWWVCVEYFSPESEEWEHASSIGMCIYADPTDPFENCYVAGMMSEAIEKLSAETAQEVC